MDSPATGSNRIWPNWWKFGGIDGIVWVVLFIIGALVLQGEVPTRGDSIEDIRTYFVDDGAMFLVGDFVLGIAFIIFFVPYVIALRWFIGTAEGSPPVWSWFSFAGGVMTTLMGFTSGIFLSAIALGLDDGRQMDDGTIRVMMDLGALGFAGALFAIALFVGAAGFVIFRTGVLWRWLGVLGLVAAVCLVVGAAWPIEGDDEGTLAIGYFIGLPGTLLFVLISSIGMIMRKEPPGPIV